MYCFIYSTPSATTTFFDVWFGFLTGLPQEGMKTMTLNRGSSHKPLRKLLRVIVIRMMMVAIAESCFSTKFHEKEKLSVGSYCHRSGSKPVTLLEHSVADITFITAVGLRLFVTNGMGCTDLIIFISASLTTNETNSLQLAKIKLVFSRNYESGLQSL